MTAAPSSTPPTTTAGEAVHTAPEYIGQKAADLTRREAWSNARFGCFVHWGLPAIPAGEWDGKRIPGLAEWIQFKARIPMERYRQLTPEFNPEKFDAREWVRRAAEAGARYFVFTAKHHDGFAMFHSKASAYNIYDATPFKRDPLAELAAACKEYGLILGLYYSQMIDWESPDAVGPQWNDWDHDRSKADFMRYWRVKAMPQLEELLTNYGPIGLMWFDMPSGLPPECAREASALVRRLQPGAVINSRLGEGGAVDYRSMDDNYFNNYLPARDWETAATTNATWAYASHAEGWKPVSSLIEALVYSISRGGNYLLNIGPDATGAFPERAKAQFTGIAEWMKFADQAIHGAGASPFAQTFEWGHVTSRGNHLYLHLLRETPIARVALPGLRTLPVSARSMKSGAACIIQGNGKPESPIAIKITPSSSTTTVGSPEVIELTFDRSPVVSTVPTQAPGEPLRLDVWHAESKNRETPLRWNFDLAGPGKWNVVLLTKEVYSNENPTWDVAGLEGTLVTPAGSTTFIMNDDGREPYPIIYYWKMVRTVAGTLSSDKAGPAWLELRDLPVSDSKWQGRAANLVGIRLEPSN